MSQLSVVAIKCVYRIRSRLQRTSGKWGGGGFEISDIPGRGEGGGGGVVCESSDVRKFLVSEKIEIPKFLRAL